MEKHKRKWGLTIITVLLTAAMLSGCGKVTAGKLIIKAMENASKASSYAGNLNMNMTMGVKQSGISMSMDIGMDMDIEATNKPSEYHMNGTFDIGFMNMSMDMETYGKLNKDGSKLITYTNINDAWTKSEADADDASSAAELMDLDSLIGKDSELTLQKELEKENGKEVFVITTTITGDKLESAEDLLGGMSGSNIEDFDMSKLKGDVVIKIDKEKCLPSSVSVDFKDGLGEGVTIESDGVEMTLDSLNMTITFDEYDTIDKITLPKEAIDAQEVSSDSAEDILGSITDDDSTDDADDADEELSTDGDGNYILRDYGDKKEILIAPLKNMELDDYSDSHSINFYMEGENYSSISAYYSVEQMDDYYTEEYLAKYLLDEKEYYTEDDGYKNVVFEDVKTVKAGNRDVKYTTLSYTFNDSLYSKTYQAWFVTEDGFAVVCDLRESAGDAQGGYLSEKIVVEAMKGVQE